MPAFHSAAEAFEDSRDLGRDRGFAVPEEPAGVIDQDQVARQRRVFQHPFTRRFRIQPASIFDRAKPDDIPSPKSHRQQPRKYPQVLAAEARSIACGERRFSFGEQELTRSFGGLDV